MPPLLVAGFGLLLWAISPRGGNLEHLALIIVGVALATWLMR